jgi:hypothetical protein
MAVFEVVNQESQGRRGKVFGDRRERQGRLHNERTNINETPVNGEYTKGIRTLDAIGRPSSVALPQFANSTGVAASGRTTASAYPGTLCFARMSDNLRRSSPLMIRGEDETLSGVWATSATTVATAARRTAGMIVRGDMAKLEILAVLVHRTSYITLRHHDAIPDRSRGKRAAAAGDVLEEIEFACTPTGALSCGGTDGGRALAHLTRACYRQGRASPYTWPQ